MTPDLDRIGAELSGVEKRASKLSWAKERPWRLESHLWKEKKVPTLDLHDLSTRLSVEVALAVEKLGPELESGAVRFITGQGGHSLGGKSTVRHALQQELERMRSKHGWEYHPQGPARFMLIIDAEKAPSSAQSGLGLGFWLAAALFGAAAIAAILSG